MESTLQLAVFAMLSVAGTAAAFIILSYVYLTYRSLSIKPQGDLLEVLPFFLLIFPGA
jgi:hypothetical protein